MPIWGINRQRVPRCPSDIEGAEVRGSPEQVDRAKRLDKRLKFGRGLHFSKNIQLATHQMSSQKRHQIPMCSGKRKTQSGIKKMAKNLLKTVARKLAQCENKQQMINQAQKENEIGRKGKNFQKEAGGSIYRQPNASDIQGHPRRRWGHGEKESPKWRRT